MSDCRFAVSPVNYPDPDPDVLKRSYHETRAENVCKLMPVLKETLLLWILVNANNKNFALSLEMHFCTKDLVAS